MAQQEPEKKDDADQEDAPLELAPVEDEPATMIPDALVLETEEEDEPATTPSDALFLEAVQEPLDEAETDEEPAEPEAEEEGEGQELPTLRPLDVGGILSWPLTGEHAFALLGGLFLVLLLFSGAWLVDRFFHALDVVDLGLLGSIMRILIACGGGIWYLAYPYRTLRATYEGLASPPAWLEFDPSGGVYSEGARVLTVLAIYATPAALVGLLGGPLALVLVLAIAAWLLVPAALLLLVASERVTRANPSMAVRLATAGGLRYLYCAAPVVPFLVLRILWGPSLFGVVLEWLAFLAFVVTALMLGLLARESEDVERVALAAGWLGEVTVSDGEEPAGSEEE